MFGKNRNYSGGNQRSGGDKINFKTRCADCDNTCTVPFKPTGSKPVLCRDCFRGSEGATSKRGRFSDKPAYQRSEKKKDNGPSLKDEIRAINGKLDRILSLLGETSNAGNAAVSKDLVDSKDDFTFQN